MRIPSNIPVLLIASVIFLSVLGACVGMWILVEREGNVLQVSAQSLADDSAHRERYDALNDLREESASDRAYLTSLILQGEDDAVSFLSTIDRLAGQLGVQLSAEQLSVREQKDDPYDALAVTFDIAGEDDAVMQLLTFFEMLPYHTVIDSVTLKRTNEASTGVARTESSITILLTITKE